MYKVPFLEPCAGCGGFCEVETESEYLVMDASHANVGDKVTCSLCSCVGTIDMDYNGKYCLWDAELCTQCQVEFERILDGLAAQIRQVVA